MERITTGIFGLDEKLNGGFVPGSVVMVSGKTGTGKTTFATSFIYAGALGKEAGVYVTTEQMEDEIKKDVQEAFGWDFGKFEKLNLVKFVSIKPIYPEKAIKEEDLNKIAKFYTIDISEKISSAIKEIGAKRVVIDSISIFEMFIQNKYLARVAIMALMESLRKQGVSTLITGEIPETSEGLSKNEIVEYLVDGIIRLDFVPVSEEFKRTLTIRKMRRTDHSILIHPFSIEKDGIRIIEI